MSKRQKITLFDIINNTILIIVALTCIYPFVYVLLLSISDGRELASGNVFLFPKGVNVEAFRYIFNNPSLNILNGLRNSFMYTLFGTIVSIFTTYMTAYVLTRRQFKGRYFIMSVFVFTWVFKAGIIPMFIVYNAFGFLNNPLVLIIPSAINTQFLIITKAFLESQPYELEEAARIDGLGDFQIMLKIYLPISQTIIATVGVFYAISIWNQYLVPQIFFKEERLFTIQQVLKKLVIDSSTDETAFRTIIQNGYTVSPMNLRPAAIFVTMVPIVIIYPFVQKYFRKGILIGSVKG